LGFSHQPLAFVLLFRGMCAAKRSLSEITIDHHDDGNDSNKRSRHDDVTINDVNTANTTNDAIDDTVLDNNDNDNNVTEEQEHDDDDEDNDEDSETPETKEVIESIFDTNDTLTMINHFINTLGTEIVGTKRDFFNQFAAELAYQNRSRKSTRNLLVQLTNANDSAHWIVDTTKDVPFQSECRNCEYCDDEGYSGDFEVTNSEIELSDERYTFGLRVDHYRLACEIYNVLRTITSCLPESLVQLVEDYSGMGFSIAYISESMITANATGKMEFLQFHHYMYEINEFDYWYSEHDTQTCTTCSYNKNITEDPKNNRPLKICMVTTAPPLRPP
jgi:hypothetical protein